MTPSILQVPAPMTMTKSSSSVRATSMPYARALSKIAGAPPPHPGGDAQGALPLGPARGIMPLDLFAAKRSSRLTPAMKRRLNTPPKVFSAGTPDLPHEKIKDFSRGDPGIPRAPHASMLTALRHSGPALRHSGRSFTAHVAESARVPKRFHPLTPGRGAAPAPRRGCHPRTPYF